MIEKVKELVLELLKDDDTGHGNSHALRVYDLSMNFAEKEIANKDVVAFAALLHDVDDYKISKETTDNLNNAKTIMNKAQVDQETQKEVLEIIRTMGYKKLLNGIRPQTIEGMIVSDADMCDTLGANGILRMYDYQKSHNKPFFDKETFPIDDMNFQKYNRDCSDSAVCHIFEKVLKVKNLMMTSAGKKEATQRESLTISFIRQLFMEEDAIEWIEYLDKYLKEENKNEK